VYEPLAMLSSVDGMVFLLAAGSLLLALTSLAQISSSADLQNRLLRERGARCCRSPALAKVAS
jgi:hypothetical protein